MPATPHAERHFTGSQIVRDAVIGMSDGLTVPFALAAGLSAAVTSTHVIIAAGLAEIAAGAIAMGLGGYLAARTDEAHYASEERREAFEIERTPDTERAELRAIFADYGMAGAPLDSVVEALSANKQKWIDFMMRYELGLERPDPRRAPVSAATIAVSYLVGGLIPLAPYMLTTEVKTALVASIVVTAVALIVFGAVKGRLTGVAIPIASLQTLLVGAVAAAAAFGLAAQFG